MTWNADQPRNNTKIRNLATVITPNWEAIEEADSSLKQYALNLANRNNLNTTDPTIPVDPVAIANAYALFSKQDAAGNPQLFGIDPSSAITQLSGGSTTLGSTGSAFLPGGLILKWGPITVAAYPTTTSLAFNTPFPNACLQVYLTATAAYSSIFMAYTTNFLPGQFSAAKGDTSASLSSSYNWFAIGY